MKRLLPAAFYLGLLLMSLVADEPSKRLKILLDNCHNIPNACVCIK
jgi:hypothetical protein